MSTERSGFRKLIENHIGIWFFGTLLTGFIAGFTCLYQGLNLLQYEIVSKDKLERIDNEKAKLEDQLKSIQVEHSKLKDEVINSRIQLSKLGKIPEAEITATINELPSVKKAKERIAKIEAEKKKEAGEKDQVEVSWYDMFIFYGAFALVLVVMFFLCILSFKFGGWF